MMNFPFALRRLSAASVLLLGLALGACSDDDDDGGGNPLPASADYVGLVTSTTGATGPLDITFASPVSTPPAPQSATGPSFSSAAPVAATGTVSLGGAPVAITGTIDGGLLNMTGGGWTLTGTLLDGQITGTFTGPGPVSGSLAAISSTEGSPAVAYCGYFAGVDHSEGDADDLGTFSVVLAGDVLLGTAVGDNGTVEDFTGTATPGATAGSGEFTIHHTTPDGVLDVSGIYTPDNTNGEYATKVGSTIVTEGNFFGTVCGAPT